uniref:Uncharacterized protein n=1 Tax=Zea mays TaxID=4577 RepID=A0A804RLG7_MAIZE
MQSRLGCLRWRLRIVRYHMSARELLPPLTITNFVTKIWWLVDLLKNQKSDKVDITIQPEEQEAMNDVLAARFQGDSPHAARTRYFKGSHLLVSCTSTRRDRTTSSSQIASNPPWLNQRGQPLA